MNIAPDINNHLRSIDLFSCPGRRSQLAKYAKFCAYLGASNMDKWCVPEKILQKCSQSDKNGSKHLYLWPTM